MTKEKETTTIPLFNNAEKLTLTALVNIGMEKGLKPYELKLSYLVVQDVLKQLNESKLLTTEKLKEHNFKLK